MADLPATADIVIVGGGVNGASIAYHLARKKAGRVLLLEKKFLASGPTGRSTALVRRFYPIEFFARTANAGADIFQNWQQIIGGDPGFRQVGFMVLVDAEGAPHLEANINRSRKVGSRVKLISPDDVKQLVPDIAVDDIALASYESESGYADPASTTNAFANRARDLGATIVQYTPTTEILTAGGKVTGVRTAKGDVSAPVVVNCAGLWANRLLAPLGIDIAIQPRRHQMCFFRRPPELGVHPAISDGPNGTYMRPDHGDLTIFGVGKYLEIVDPDQYNEGADPSEIDRDAELIARRIPIMENGLARGGYSGVYDFTLDGEPVLGAIPEYTGLYACFGWSGHGFKHSPITGDIISEVILHGRHKNYDITPFRWTRFREGDLLPPHYPTAPPSERAVP
ncbi:MAG: FAD-binding oxidoreductase [Chloroflexi bacterium]|nr:FAD-binding oxidoreductase [Chloroflexota bacterium]